MPPSQVWHYFKKTDSGKKARCSKCSKLFTYCGSTTTLATHLEKSHRIKISQKKNNKDAIPNDSMDVSDGESQDNMADPICRSSSEVNSPIIKAFQNAAAYTNQGEKTAKITDALMYMIAVDSMPFSAPERRGFQKFCKTIQPLYKFPSRKTREKLMNAKYELLKEKVFKRLENAEHITLTTDLWTETMNTKSFLGVTAHYLESTEMKSVDIGAMQIVERKTIPNLQQALLSICKSWHIDPDRVITIVTDNGPNIVGACKAAFGANKHLSCFAHTLNLVAMKSIDFYEASVEAELPDNEDTDDDDIGDETAPSQLKDIIRKLKKIVGFFRRCESATTELCRLQKVESNIAKKLVQEVKTSWNSLYHMIERYLELHEQVSQSLRKVATEKSSKTKPPSDLTTDEVESLIEVQKILKPLFLATQELCSEKNVTLSKVMPLVKMLQSSIENMYPLDGVAFELRNKLLTNMRERFQNIEKNFLFCAATILDPRFKKLHFSSNVAVANTVSKIAVRVTEKLASTLQITSSTNQGEGIVQQPLDSLWQMHDHLAETQQVTADQDVTGGIPAELRQYLNQPVSQRNSDPLDEWERLKTLYPHVYKVAREYMGILATSVPCERLFSKAGLIITQRRNRMTSKHLNQQLFLRNLSESDWFE